MFSPTRENSGITLVSLIITNQKSQHVAIHTQDGERLSYLSKYCFKKWNLVVQKNYKMTEDLTKKNDSLNFKYFRYAGRERMHIFIIKQVHVKSINVTTKQGTKVIHRIKDMDIYFFFIIITDIIANLF